jgi:hypothetical protein
VPRNSIYLFGLGALSILAATYQGIASWYGLEGSERLMGLWGALFVLVLVLWIDADSRTQPRITRPFEYGWLVLLYWIPYTPYYFWRTRGSMGLLMFAGVVCLFLSGWIVQWLIFIAR